MNASPEIHERVRERAERINGSHSHSNVARALARDSLALVAENQQLRDALRVIAATSEPLFEDELQGIARAALDGKPSAPPLPPPSETHIVRSGLAQTAKPHKTEPNE